MTFKCDNIFSISFLADCFMYIYRVFPFYLHNINTNWMTTATTQCQLTLTIYTYTYVCLMYIID